MSWTPTAISDLLQKTPISDYITAFLPDQTAFAQAGLVTPQFNDLVMQGGSSVELRRFIADANRAEIDDGSASEGNKLSSYKDIGIVARRKRVRPYNMQTIAAMGGEIVAGEIQAQAPYFWGREIDYGLQSILTAAFDLSAGVLRTTHLNDKAAASGTPVTANLNIVIDTAKKHGDMMSEITSLICHSYVWADLKKESAAKETGSLLVGNGSLRNVGTYYGYNVYVSDRVPTSGSSTFKKYWSFLVRPNAFGLMWQKEIQTLSSYSAEKNALTITQWGAYAPHLFGVKWTGTPASADGGPTDAELATGTNWAKIANDNKEIGVVAFTSNATV